LVEGKIPVMDEEIAGSPSPVYGRMQGLSTNLKEGISKQNAAPVDRHMWEVANGTLLHIAEI